MTLDEDEELWCLESHACGKDWRTFPIYVPSKARMVRALGWRHLIDAIRHASSVVAPKVRIARHTVWYLKGIGSAVPTGYRRKP